MNFQSRCATFGIFVLFISGLSGVLADDGFELFKRCLGEDKMNNRTYVRKDGECAEISTNLRVESDDALLVMYIDLIPGSDVKKMPARLKLRYQFGKCIMKLEMISEHGEVFLEFDSQQVWIPIRFQIRQDGIRISGKGINDEISWKIECRPFGKFDDKGFNLRLGQSKQPGTDYDNLVLQFKDTVDIRGAEEQSITTQSESMSTTQESTITEVRTTESTSSSAPNTTMNALPDSTIPLPTGSPAPAKDNDHIGAIIGIVSLVCVILIGILASIVYCCFRRIKDKKERARMEQIERRHRESEELKEYRKTSSKSKYKSMNDVLSSGRADYDSDQLSVRDIKRAGPLKINIEQPMISNHDENDAKSKFESNRPFTWGPENVIYDIGSGVEEFYTNDGKKVNPPPVLPHLRAKNTPPPVLPNTRTKTYPPPGNSTNGS